MLKSRASPFVKSKVHKIQATLLSRVLSKLSSIKIKIKFLVGRERKKYELLIKQPYLAI